jgi:hypothetical protein
MGGVIILVLAWLAWLLVFYGTLAREKDPETELQEFYRKQRKSR